MINITLIIAKSFLLATINIAILCDDFVIKRRQKNEMLAIFNSVIKHQYRQKRFSHTEALPLIPRA